jgi:predicted secreted protein
MYLFTNFLLFILIWWIVFFITLPMNISISNKPEIGHATSAPKKTYIRLKVIITSSISVLIMIILIYMKFDLGVIFKL